MREFQQEIPSSPISQLSDGDEDYQHSSAWYEECSATIFRGKYDMLSRTQRRPMLLSDVTTDELSDRKIGRK